MSVITYLVLMNLLSMAVHSAARINQQSPDCALRCWENSKYVSRCLNDSDCLCNDLGYQNAVFQCVYAQCDTTHFGTAIHHTISQCESSGSNFLLTVIPTGHHEELRKREVEYLAGNFKLEGSGSPVGCAVETAGYGGYATGSAGSDGYATKSAGNGNSLITIDASLPLPTPLNTGTGGSPGGGGAGAAFTTTTTSHTNVTATSPLSLFTGASSTLEPSLIFVMLISFVGALYFAL